MGGEGWRHKQKRAGTAAMSGTGTGRRNAGRHPVQCLLRQDRKSERRMALRAGKYGGTCVRDLPVARRLPLCLSKMSPFQGAQTTPNSWVIAKALVY